MNNKKIYQKPENNQKKTVGKVEAQVQRAFLNILCEQGIVPDRVCMLAMRRITEGV
ncbi:MAG: hypothetical protein HFH52_07525 [Lachnospiraceae bacterium]|nr:hypothetical protein [Lachnospiraceae bacterium]